jgi:hypothetical protein
VLAYLECKDSVVYLLWVRDRSEVVEFPSLRDAVDAIDAILVGGSRDRSAGRDLRPAARRTRTSPVPGGSDGH